MLPAALQAPPAGRAERKYRHFLATVNSAAFLGSFHHGCFLFLFVQVGRLGSVGVANKWWKCHGSCRTLNSVATLFLSRLLAPGFQASGLQRFSLSSPSLRLHSFPALLKCDAANWLGVFIWRCKSAWER